MATQLFVPPEELELSDNTIVNKTNEEPELPQPNVEVETPRSRVKVGKRQRRPSFGTPYTGTQLGSDSLNIACRTPVRSARSAFKKLRRNSQSATESYPEEDLKNSLTSCLYRMVAQPKNPIEAVAVALSAGANPNFNDPVTPLYLAIDNDNEDYCKILLENGASIVKKNKKRDVKALPIAKAFSKSPDSNIFNLFVTHIRALELNDRMQAAVQNGTPLKSDSPVQQQAQIPESPIQEPPRKKQRIV